MLRKKELAPHLKDKSPLVRVEAVQLAGISVDPGAIGLLPELLGDPDNSE